jgi:hypothetical protein
MAEELQTWMDETEPERVEAVLEFLKDKEMLTTEGRELRSAFYNLYVGENECENCHTIEKGVIPMSVGRPPEPLWLCEDCRTPPEYYGETSEEEKQETLAEV